MGVICLLLHSLTCYYCYMGISQSSHVLQDSTSHRSISLSIQQWSTECKFNTSKRQLRPAAKLGQFYMSHVSIFSDICCYPNTRLHCINASSSVGFRRAESYQNLVIRVCFKQVLQESKPDRNATAFNCNIEQFCSARKFLDAAVSLALTSVAMGTRVEASEYKWMEEIGNRWTKIFNSWRETAQIRPGFKKEDIFPSRIS